MKNQIIWEEHVKCLSSSSNFFSIAFIRTAGATIVKRHLKKIGKTFGY